MLIGAEEEAGRFGVVVVVESEVDQSGNSTGHSVIAKTHGSRVNSQPNANLLLRRGSMTMFYQVVYIRS
jgi:hypothetical protein